MATASTPSSAISRYRPFVLSLTGFAAAYCAYILYSTVQNSPRSAPIRRRNAVHHRRPAGRRSLDQTRGTVPTEVDEEPEMLRNYGTFRFRHGNGTNHTILLSTARLPTLNMFQELFELSPGRAHEEVGRVQRLFIERYIAFHYARYTVGDPDQGQDQLRLSLQIVFQRLGFTQQNIDDGLDRFFTEGPQLEALIGMASPDDFDDAGTEVGSHRAPPPDAEGQRLKQLLYYIAEDQATNEGYVHRGVTCNQCDIKPITGVRWRCSNCADYDLCSECHASRMHTRTHIFYEVKIPAPFLGNPQQVQPVPYPGRPHLLPRSLPLDLCKRLVTDTNFEKSEVEALYDQFTCLAGYQWENDPNKIGAAIDRQSFEKAFVPLASINPARPNLIYDRMFAFYDTDGNGLIGFEEFLRGLACKHDKSKDVDKLRKVFDGYDMDGNGYVSRKDFLRIFRAFYAVQKGIARDLLATQEEELTLQGCLDTIMSSQPLSQAFTNFEIPAGDRGTPFGKVPDNFGDRRGAENPFRQNGEDTIDREEVIGHSWESRAGLPFVQPENEPLSARQIRAQIPRSGGLTQQREVRFMYDGQMVQDGRDEAVNERLRRTEFYTDSEEGFHSLGAGEYLNGYASSEIGEKTDLPSPALHQPSDESRPEMPRSRSSSKVRFQDDVGFETRSNASTSSRPFNERFGGYEIPDAEKDFGREILYQVAEDGMNELLDALFKEKEDMTMTAWATRYERRKCRTELAAYTKKKEDEMTRKALKAERAAMEARDPLMATAAVLDTIKPISEATTRGAVTRAVVAGSADRRQAAELEREGLEVNDYAGSDHVENGVPQASRPTFSNARESTEPNDVGRVVHDRGTSRCTEPSFDTYTPPSSGTSPSAHTSGPSRPTTAASSTIENNAEDEVRGLGFEREIHRPIYDRLSDTYTPPVDSRPPLFTSTYDTLDIQPLFDARKQQDQTFPQFRPNSAADVDPTLYIDPTQPNFVHHKDPTMLQTRPTRSEDQRLEDEDLGEYTGLIMNWFHTDPRQSEKLVNSKAPLHAKINLDETRLAELARHDNIDRESKTRGGPGRLSFQEFENVMRGKRGRSLAFVEQWLELGSF